MAFAQKTIRDWPYYAGTLGSARYSPLDQITPENVVNLERAWKWDSADEALREKNPRLRAGYFKITPLVVDGVMYTSTALSQIAAIDPGTGETLWVHDPEAYLRPGARRMYQHRGLAYWTNGTKRRIVITTGTRQLITIDAETGKRDMIFGTDGWVDLGKGFDPPIIETQLYYSAPPLIVRDTIVVGGSMADEASNPGLPRGNIRGYDVETGDHKWTFNTIPVAGEYGVETWENDSWVNTGAANAWSMMSGDEELGYVYAPTGTPANDFYGGHRLGDTLFAESIVCIDVESGERVWHFQAVHHGLWDYDLPAAPILLDITVNGESIKALAQVSKQGFTYVFDRVTGDPVWPIEERPVPQSTVPGERTSPTQPFPTKPPPFELQGLTEDDLIDFTPELRQEALDFVKNYTMGPLFTPPSLITDMKTGAGATL
jgi:quinoprotein glucose dehydrogenase